MPEFEKSTRITGGQKTTQTMIYITHKSED
jgi:hypothetical protein